MSPTSTPQHPITMNLIHSLVSVSVLTALGGCALPSLKAMPSDPEPRVVETMPTQSSTRQPDWVAKKQPQAEPKLYARDGSVVGAQEPGTVAVTPQNGRGSAEDGGSRWTLLEQYQDAVSENEDMELELRAMNQALDEAETREAEMTTLVRELQATLASTRTEVGQLQEQNLELASRLTTAQIRRLQSEKLLLEAKLDWKRVEMMINADEGGPAEPGTPGDETQPASAQMQQPSPLGEQP